MTQGWKVDGAADTITFFEAPAAGGLASNAFLVIDGIGVSYSGQHTSWASFVNSQGAGLNGWGLVAGGYIYLVDESATQTLQASVSVIQTWTTLARNINGISGEIIAHGGYIFRNFAVEPVERKVAGTSGAWSTPLAGSTTWSSGMAVLGDKLVIVSQNFGQDPYYSTDYGASWTAGTNYSSIQVIEPKAASNGSRLCVALRESTGGIKIKYTDSITGAWSGVVYTVPTSTTEGIVAPQGFRCVNGKWVLITTGGKVAYSSDGATWSAGTTITGGTIKHWAFNGSKIVVIKNDFTMIQSDDFGVTWVTFTGPTASNNRWVYWVNDESVEIAVREFSAGAYGGSTSLWALGAWSDHFGFPYEVEYYGDRMFFANTRSQPQTLWGSRVSGYSDFGKSSPIQDDDAFASTLNARQVNEIRDLVPLDNMLCMTTGGEWKVTGGANNVLTPQDTGFQPQSYRGVSNVQGVVVGNSALFIQDRGSVVRDLAWKFDSDGYDGNDLSIFAAHLIDGYTLVDMAYQQYPNSVVWLVRSDGGLLGITYVREQEVVGWHRHDTDGFVENVCCVPESGGDVLYICVRRVINGQTKRFIERLETRDIFDQVDSFFVDCGLSYDGRNTSATTVTVTGGTLWDETENLTVTASLALFTFASGTGDSTWIGDHIKIGSTRFMIVDWTSTTVVTVRVIGTVPAAIRGVATTDFVLMRDRITGLGHLEGKTVSVLSDGNEEAQKVVTSGAITLDRPGGVVHVGLPYVSDFETLEVNSIGSETIRDRKKTIPSVTVLVDKSAGVFAGPDYDHLEMHRPRVLENYDQPTPLLTGAAIIQVTTRWDESGRLCIRQTAPLPLSILGVIPELKVTG